MAASCPKCGNGELLEGVRIKVPGSGVDDVQAVVTPTSGMIRQQTGSELRGTVCAACGYTELFVADPALIAERWRSGER